jgi:hypothetical protein
MRKPETGPLGETLFDASVRAIAGADFVNSPAGGCVESVVTVDTHRLFFRVGMGTARPFKGTASGWQAFDS